MPGAAFRQTIVGVAGDALGLIVIAQRLHARGRQGEDRPVDAGGIHVRQPALTEIEQALHDLNGALRRAAPVEAPKRVQALVGRAVAHHAQVYVDLLPGRESLLRGDAQITSVSAGLQLVRHDLLTLRVLPWSPGMRASLRSHPRARVRTI